VLRCCAGPALCFGADAWGRAAAGLAGTGRALGFDCGGVASSSAGGDSAMRSRKRQAVAPQQCWAAAQGKPFTPASASALHAQQAKSAHGPKHQATTAAACSDSLARGAGS